MKVRQIIEQEEAVVDIHSLIGRNAGRCKFLEAVVEVRKRGLEEAYLVAHRLERTLREEIPHLELPSETNPFLGHRGIRLCLSRPDLFKPQLRAVLRAGVEANLCIMFPMIATVDEVRSGRDCAVENDVSGVSGGGEDAPEKPRLPRQVTGGASSNQG